MTDPRARVVFGVGAIARIGAELAALNRKRPLVITTPGRLATLTPVRGYLGDRLVGVFAGAALHVPIERVREALEQVDRRLPDSLISIGGGSAVGLAKAVALERRLPIIAVPTTYAGSEMTSIWGITDGEQKRTGREPRVAPKVVIYDPELTLNLPADVSAASGMNAIAHAVETMYAADASPVATAQAATAIRLLARALPRVVARLDDLDARTEALQGAHAAGVALGLASMGLHHRICHVLGGTFGLPHALTHAAVLPHVLAYNAPEVPAAMARIADALGVPDALIGLTALNRMLGLNATLGDLGLRPSSVDRCAALIVSSPYPNPRLFSEEDVRRLLIRAL